MVFSHPRYPCLHWSLMLSLAVALAASPAPAATLTWNGTTGNAATSTRWSPQQVPTSLDDLFFPGSTTFTITFDNAVTASRSHTYRNTVTATLNITSPHTVSNGITVGQFAGDACTMTLATGLLTCTAPMIVGDDPSSMGTLNVDTSDAELIVSGATSDLTIGLDGDAAMNITNRGHVQVGDQFIAGSNASSSPAIVVSGSLGTPPFGSSFLEVLGTGQSRIGQGGDATLTVSSGALADFAGDLVIANGSLSTSSVTVQTAVLLNARLQVADDLLIGRNITNFVAAGTGTLTINTGGTTTVGGDTFLGDPDGGTGTMVMGGGTFNGTLPVNLENGSAITGFGTVNAGVNVGAGSILATSTGLTLNGIVNCTTAGVLGTKVHFGPSGGYTGSGQCATEITSDPAAVITATGALTLGKNVVTGFDYDGLLDVGAQAVTLTDSNGAVLGGLATLGPGGNLSAPSGLGVELGGRVRGEGTVTANVVMAGALDPQRTPTPGGILQVTGNLTMNPSGSYEMELGGTPPSAMHDRCNVSGTAAFDGTLRVALPTGYVPRVGEQFIAINATAGRTGEFASIVPPSPGPCNNVTFVMVYSSTAAIVLIRPPLGCTALGDLNSDGACSAPDIQLMVNALLSPGYESCADMDGDCLNDVDDIPIFTNCLL